MPPIAGAALRVLCLCCSVLAAQCAFSDELSLIQTNARDAPPQGKWPDIGKIVEEAHEAAESASHAAEEVNNTISGAMDQATTATKTAIDMIVTTVQAGLQHILTEADALNSTIQEAVDGLLAHIESAPQLKTFEDAAKETLEAALASYEPLVFSLEMAATSLEKILKASGFLHLSQTVDEALAAAIAPLNQTRATFQAISLKLAGLDAKINASAGNISAEVGKDLDFIDNKLHEMVEALNTTFIPKIIEAYGKLVAHLHATAEGMLPVKFLNQVVPRLQTLPPMAAQIADRVSNPLGFLATGFETATGRLRQEVPSSAYGSLGISLFTLLVSVGVGMM